LKSTDGVPHPCVLHMISWLSFDPDATDEIPICLRRTSVDIVVKTRRLHLLGKGEEVGRSRKIPFFGCPEVTGCPYASLHLVLTHSASDIQKRTAKRRTDYKCDSLVRGKLPQPAKEARRSMVIPSFRRYWLNDECCDRFDVLAETST